MKKFDNLPTAEVLSRQDIASNLMIIKIKPEVKIYFQPGQYCTLCLDDGPCRPYSIVSSPEEDFLEFFIELIDDGELTPQLWELRPGNRLKIFTKTKGKFVFDLDNKFKNYCFVSTVTGIAPFISMVRHAAVTNGWQGQKVFIFQGASYQDELGYNHELSAADFCRYFPTISRPKEVRNAGWQGLTGRVNNIFTDFLEKSGFSPAETLIYACGHPEMIEDIKSKVGRLGFEIREERYFRP